MPMLFWLLFIGLIAFLIAVDLYVMNKSPDHEMTFGESMTWTLVWIGCALLFNFGIYWIYENQLIPTEIRNGKEAALLFFTGYLIEKSLSLDNIFVIAMIFSYFSIPAKLQHRVLIWGVFGAMVMRFVMIISGSALLQQFTWMTYVFGALLIFTAVKMLVMNSESLDPDKNPLVRLARRYFPVTKGFRGHSFFVREKGTLFMTPLFLALIVVETTDVIFAIDSIPAIFAITRDPFIIFTSNIFAILGLRALYFVLVAALNRFHYLRFSLVFLLAFVGVKMLIQHYYQIDTLVSLFIILGILAVGVLASIIAKNGAIMDWLMPFYEQMKEIAIITTKDIKRIGLLLVGVTILLMGLAMLVLPGPGILFIVLGLMLLAKEFIWARKLLKKLKGGQETVSKLFSNDEKKS